MTSLDFSTHSQLRLRPSVQRQIRICSSSGFPKVIRKNTTIRALLSAEIIGFRVPAKCGEMLHIFYSHLFKCKWGRLKNKRMNTLIKKKVAWSSSFLFQTKETKEKESTRDEKLIRSHVVCIWAVQSQSVLWWQHYFSSIFNTEATKCFN